MITKNSYNNSIITKNTYGAGSLSALSIEQSEHRYDVGYYKDPLSFAKQAFFIPGFDNFDLVNNEIINYKQDGNNLKLADGYCWNSEVTDNIQPTATFNAKTLTEFTAIQWLYNHTPSDGRVFNFANTNIRLDNANKRLWVIGQSNVSAQQFSANNSLVYPQLMMIGYTVKSGELQELSINGQVVSSIPSVLTSLSGTLTLTFAKNISQIGASFFNFSLWNKKFSAADMLYMYQHPYALFPTASGNISASNCMVWYKMNDGPIAGKFLDASGNYRDSNSIASGFKLSNNWWFANQFHGFCSSSTYPFAPIMINGLSYINMNNFQTAQGTGRLFQQDGSRLLPGEFNIYQKNPGMGTQWYDSQGTALKKSFSDFQEINSNLIFFDKHYVDYAYNMLSFDSVPESQLLTKLASYINYGKKDSKHIMIASDSMFGGENVNGNNTESLHGQERIYMIANQGGAHSDVVIDLFTTFLSTHEYYRHYIFMLWIGTNNITEHELIAQNIRDAAALSSNSDKKMFVVMPVSNTQSGYNIIKSAIDEVGAIMINIHKIMNEIFNELYNDSVNHPVLQKLIELDINNDFIIQVDEHWYIYNDKCPRTNASGQPLSPTGTVVTTGQEQGTIAKFMQINCNIPNTLVTIKNIQYDVSNPCIINGATTGINWSQDTYPLPITDIVLWSLLAQRDGTHPMNFTLMCILAYVYVKFDENNW